MTMTQNDHIWFEEQIAAYLSHGLAGDDLARFEAHRDACAACAAKLQSATGEDAQLHDLFVSIAPSSDFEDRMIQGLRTTRHRTLRLPTIHPAIRKAALAAAAVIVLGGFGYVASELMTTTNRYMASSSLRQIGSAVQLYANEDKGTYPREDWDFNGGVNTTLNWSTWDKQPNKNRSYYYGVDGDGIAAKRTDRFSGGFAVAGDKTKSAGNVPSAGRQLNQLRQAAADSSLRGTKSSDTSAVDAEKTKNREGQNVLYGDGHVTFEQNPFGGVQVDSFYTRRAPDAPRYFKPIEGVTLDYDVDASTSGKLVDRAKLPAQSGPEKVKALGEELKQQAQQGQQQPALKPQEDVKRVSPGAAVDTKDAPVAPLADNVEPEIKPAAPPAPAVQPPPPAPTTQAERKIIRNGTLEFEIDSFDNAVLTVAKIVREEGGFVGTTTSEKLPNGKVKGAIMLRVPPDHLDTLVLKLRGLGDLKRQNLTADDVTKAYSDLQSELRAALAMQERLIDLIKNGKGAIKDLLAAEKELGVWREKIEKVQGEINYYNNLVSMATLNLSLFERDIRQAAEVKQTEDVNMGVESEDVEQSRNGALKAIEDAKGRIIESELKKFEAGQFAAKIVADVTPDQAGAVIDRLKQLGKVARLEIQRKQTAPSDVVVKDGLKVERGDTRLNISLYNLANVAPRQTVNLNLASEDVEKSYHAILARIEKAGGRVVSSNLNRVKPDQTAGSIQFETKSADADTVLQDIRALGEAMKMTIVENSDTANVTTTKRGFSIQIASTATVAPREVSTLNVAATDVPVAYRALLESARTLGFRVTESQMSQVDPQNMSATMTIELKRDQQAEFEKVLTAQGQVLNRNVTRSADNENTLDSKLRWQLALVDADRIAPRQNSGMTIESSDVEQSLAQITAVTEGAGGRVADSGVSKNASGASTARAKIDVPLDQAAAVIDAIRGQGKVREIQSSKNMDAPDGPLARAHIELAITNGERIVGDNSGLWATIRNGLATSVSGLLWSLQLIIIGLCLVAPWVLLVWAGWKVIRRRKATAPGTA